MANEAEIIASNILSSAIEYKRLYDQTKNNEYKVKEQRLRRIAENVKLLLSSTSTSSVNSFNGRTGAVVLTSADVTTALGYTPPTNLNGLTDVTLSAPANGQVLTYNSTTSQWENQTPAGGGGGGDMLKSTYDVDNDGTVDSAERIEIIVRNSTGTTLTKGTVVYLSGATGNRPNAVRAQADTEATSSKTFGIVVADINNNSDGYVACNGTLHDLDTSAFADGTALWLSATTAGAYTSTIPAEPNHTVFIGYVARSHPTQGRLVILIQNGYELNELHGVLISAEANNDLLVYESSSTLWKNKSISTIFGGTPLVSVPTLAQVTTAGNTTTNAITVGKTTVIHTPSNGDYIFRAESTQNRLELIHPGSGGATLQMTSTLNSGYTKEFIMTGKFKISTEYFGNAVYFGNSSTTYTIFTNTNNFAIGTTTDAGYKLDVNGTTRVQSSFTGAVLKIDGTGAATGFEINSQLDNDLRPSYIVFSRGGTQKYIVGHSYGRSGFFISNGNDTVTYLNINSAGNVLVGTTTDGNAKFVVAGSITAASAIARGVYFNNTLVAAANNDVLVGLDINPTFTNGAFTGVSNLAARIQGNTEISRTGADTQLTVARGGGASFTIQGKANSTSQSEGVNLYWTNNTWLKFVLGSSVVANFSNVGNLLVGTSTDAGYKLDVNGTARISGALDIITGARIINTGGASSKLTFRNNSAALWGGFIFVNGVTGGVSGNELLTISTTSNGFRNPLYIGSSFDINTNNPNINASAQVEIASTTKGFLQPRMTNAQALAITTPATGLQVYDTTNNKNLLYNGTSWQNIAIETWLTSGSNIYYNTGNVGIGTTTPTDKIHIVDNTNGNKFGRISAGGTDASAAWVAQNDQVDNVVYRVFGSAVTGTQMGISLARSASLMANLGGSGKFLVGTYSSTDFVMGTGNQERMRLVDTTGNFLIGTTADNGNKLQVSGSIDSTGYRINNIAGYTGLLMIPGNPPGMQNVDIQGGIIVNIF